MKKIALIKKPVLLLVVMLILTPMLYGSGETGAVAEPVATKSWIDNVSEWYEENMNYATITVLMTVESSFIPFPSEIVIPPAAYVASQPDSKLNIFLVVIFATLGALLGAFINYFLALWLGRPVLYRLADSKMGKLLLLSSEKIQRAEAYFNEHGKISTFIGRLIPGIRQLISIPAGLSKMNVMSFSIFTALGAGIWNTVLALLGYIAHGQKDMIDKYSHEIGLAIVCLLLLVGVFYIVRYFIKKKVRQ